jgi:hypothetical protein
MMSKLEDPMILQYWEEVGGTLITSSAPFLGATASDAG